MAQALSPNARSKGRGDPWLKVAREPTAALARTAGVTTGERAAIQVRSRRSANAERAIGVRKIGGTKFILTAKTWKAGGKL
jgi:hypothetical protein